MRTILLALTLAGCASSGQPFIVDATPHQVSVSRANMIGSAGQLQMAEAHCAKFGKHAEYVGGGDTFVSHYRCASE